MCIVTYCKNNFLSKSIQFFRKLSWQEGVGIYDTSSMLSPQKNAQSQIKMPKCKWKALFSMPIIQSCFLVSNFSRRQKLWHDGSELSKK